MNFLPGVLLSKTTSFHLLRVERLLENLHSLMISMASLRRSKNYASDAQTPMFLYTILKQLDLRSIDWNSVADKLDISNGHAARMRYSRMKSQFEGVAAQPRAPRPKKEKKSSKSTSKDKGKGKRLLLEEEEERLTREEICNERPELQYPTEKRIKRNPPPDLEAPLQHLVPNPYEQFMDPTWSAPTIKFEAPIAESGLTSISDHGRLPLVKQEPDLFSTKISTFSPVIKNEPPGLMICDRSNAPLAGNIKMEPGTAFLSRNTDNSHINTGMAGLQPSTPIDAGMRQPLFHHLRNPRPETLDPSCDTARSLSMAVGIPSFRHRRPIADYFPASESSPYRGPNFMFSPLATSFEDLLAMPLQELAQPDFGGVNPITCADIGNMNTGLDHSQSMDDVMTHAEEGSVPGEEIDGLDQLVNHLSNTHQATRTDMIGEDADMGGKTDHTFEVKTKGATTANKGDSQKSHASVGNVLIKQEIIEIDD
jgi:hypothetical protein